MYSCSELLKTLADGAHDEALGRLYAMDNDPRELDSARERAIKLTERLLREYPRDESLPAALFSGPGRTELGGNHTDHQHGNVLCGSVDMDMLACASLNGLNVIRIKSEGFPELCIDIDSLQCRREEINTSAALVRGVAARIRELGYAIKGLDACITSNVPPGSGLSSSAAYEVLIGNILNYFCCGSALTPVEIAKIGQYAENVYFGKPSGLMDQMGSAVGGAVAIDFRDPQEPVVRRAGYDFAESGHALCIVDTCSCHADLSGDYADITAEMGAIAGQFGKKVLRDVPEEEFRAAIPGLRAACGDRAVLRAMHFFDDDRRAVEEAKALMEGDFARFLSIANQSGLSSALHLQNTWAISDPGQQAIPVALAVGSRLLEGTGAIRVHGGGFAGTIQAFVPNDRVAAFKAGMEELLGEGKCHILHIRPIGGCVVAG